MSTPCLQKTPFLVFHMLILWFGMVAFIPVDWLSNRCYKFGTCSTSEALMIQRFLNDMLKICWELKGHWLEWFLISFWGHSCPDCCNSSPFIQFDAFWFMLNKQNEVSTNQYCIIMCKFACYLGNCCCIPICFCTYRCICEFTYHYWLCGSATQVFFQCYNLWGRRCCIIILYNNVQVCLLFW